MTPTINTKTKWAEYCLHNSFCVGTYPQLGHDTEDQFTGLWTAPQFGQANRGRRDMRPFLMSETRSNAFTVGFVARDVTMSGLSLSTELKRPFYGVTECNCMGSPTRWCCRVRRAPAAFWTLVIGLRSTLDREHVQSHRSASQSTLVRRRAEGCATGNLQLRRGG